MFDKNLEKIKSSIFQKFNQPKVYLIGSRARQDHEPDSDYDILIVIQDQLTLKENINYRSALRISLAKEKIYVDFIVQSELELKIKKKIPGNIVFYAFPVAVLI